MADDREGARRRLIIRIGVVLAVVLGLALYAVSPWSGVSGAPLFDYLLGSRSSSGQGLPVSPPGGDSGAGPVVAPQPSDQVGAGRANPGVPEVPAPEGWKVYRFDSGDVGFAYPPDWSVADEEDQVVALTNAGDSGLTLVVGDIAVVDPQSDKATQSADLETAYAALIGERDRVEFGDKGQLDAPHQPAYVSGTVSSRRPGRGERSIVVSYATDGTHSALVILEYSGQRLSPADLVSLLSQLAQQFHFQDVQLPGNIGKRA